MPSIGVMFNRIPKSLGPLVFVSLLGVILGFLRESLIAYHFGATAVLDAFLVALAIPLFLATNIPQISIDVMLPLYVDRLKKGSQGEAGRLLGQWFYACILVVAMVAVLLYCGGNNLVQLMAPGFSETQRHLAVSWLSGLLPFVITTGASGVFMVVLNAHRWHVTTQIARLLINVAVLTALVIFAGSQGLSAVAAGYVAGGAAMCAVLMVQSQKLQPNLLNRPSLQEPWRLPVSASAAMIAQTLIQQLGAMVDRAFGSMLPEGSIAAFNYAMAINSVPSTVLSTALGTVIFPLLSEEIASGRPAAAFLLIRKWATVCVLLLILPIVLLICFREGVVTLLFARGQFDTRAVGLTSEALTILPLNIALHAVGLLASRFLLARRMAWAFALIVAGMVVIRALLNLLLVKDYGLSGLAISNVVSTAVATSLSLVVSWKVSKRYQADVKDRES